jgi:dihydroflavonol-4-reductase
MRSSDVGSGPMRVLVTGGTGFVGGAAARRLRAQGHVVRLFARPSERAQRLAAEGFEVVTGDVRDPEAVSRAVAGQDAVLHLAANYRAEGVPIRVFEEVNVEGTRHVLAACERHTVRRLVHASTTGVYGRVFDPPADEDHPCRPPWDHYQRTKREGELLALRAFAGPLAGRGVVVRPTGVYGPGDTRFLKLLRPLARGLSVVPGSRRVLYHPTYVDDAATGLALAVTHSAAAGHVFNLAGPRYYTMGEYLALAAAAVGARPPRIHLPLAPLRLAAVVCELAGRALRFEPPLYRRRLNFFRDHRAFVIDRARRVLGFEPEVELAEGLARTVAWSRAQGLL